MRKLWPILLLPLLFAAPHAPRAEEVVCLERPEMIDTLIGTYGEQLAEVYPVAGRGLLEFHVSPEDGSWTALITQPDGVSCVLATGEGLDPEKASAIETGLRI